MIKLRRDSSQHSLPPAMIRFGAVMSIAADYSDCFPTQSCCDRAASLRAGRRAVPRAVARAALLRMQPAAHLYRVARLDIKSDRLAREGFDEDLHGLHDNV